MWIEACIRVVWLSYSLGHVDHSLTLTMDFPTCGSTATDLRMVLFTQYKTIRGLQLSAMSLSRSVSCQDVCLAVTSRAPIQWFQINPNCTRKKHIRTTTPFWTSKKLILIIVTENVQNFECIYLLWKMSFTLLFQILKLSFGYTCALLFPTVLNSGIFLSCVEFRIIFEVQLCKKN